MKYSYESIEEQRLVEAVLMTARVYTYDGLKLWWMGDHLDDGRSPAKAALDGDATTVWTAALKLQEALGR